jgi:lipopolysaccharide export system protein LptA
VNYLKDFRQVKGMVANGNVRMSQGTRFATGDHGVLDQAKHTVTLTGNPVVHDGDDEVSGTKITVHLDTSKSEVEGARAVFFPKEQKTRDNKTAAANPS